VSKLLYCPRCHNKLETSGEGILYTDDMFLEYDFTRNHFDVIVKCTSCNYRGCLIYAPVRLITIIDDKPGPDEIDQAREPKTLTHKGGEDESEKVTTTNQRIGY